MLENGDGVTSGADTASHEAAPASEPSSTTSSPDTSQTSGTTPVKLADALKADAKLNAGSPAVEPAAASPLTDQERKAITEAGRKQAKAEFERKYGWVLKEGLDEQRFRETSQFAKRLASPTERAGFIGELVSELMRDPAAAQSLRQSLAPHLTAPTSQAEDVEPQMFVVDPRTGETLLDPAKMAAREAWLKRQWMAEINKEIAPLKQSAEALQLERQAVELDREVTTHSTDIFGYLKSLPDFAANQKEIAAAFDEDVQALLEKNPGASPDSIANVALRAYHKVTIPKQTTAAEARVQATLKDKASARTASPNGRGGSTVSAKDGQLDLATELKKEFAKTN